MKKLICLATDVIDRGIFHFIQKMDIDFDMFDVTGSLCKVIDSDLLSSGGDGEITIDGKGYRFRGFQYVCRTDSDEYPVVTWLRENSYEIYSPLTCLTQQVTVGESGFPAFEYIASKGEECPEQLFSHTVQFKHPMKFPSSTASFHRDTNVTDYQTSEIQIGRSYSLTIESKPVVKGTEYYWLNNVVSLTYSRGSFNHKENNVLPLFELTLKEQSVD